ncbi:tetratricopeptide repeat protein [Fundidesulfovibrio butyratiphilus]
MYKLSQLLERLPGVSQPKLVGSGIGVWVVWEGKASAVISQIFNEFGGFSMAKDSSQSLWFFFGEEGMRALGRLSSYARMNKLPTFIEAFPASLMVGYKYETTLSVAGDLTAQEADPAQDMEIYIHPQFNNLVGGLTGLSLKPVTPPPGMVRTEFSLLQADLTLSQDSPLAWYFVLRPLGDPLDKNTADGWRSVFSEMQTLIERQALKYIAHEGYLIFTLDSLRSLRTFCKDVLLLENQLRNPESGKKYWPTIMACVLKKGYTFNKDLPKRINLDWRQLAPDLPHMSFRSALYLGKGFRINDVRTSHSVQTLDDWCNVGLDTDDEQVSQGEVPFKLPPNLLAGPNIPCFYCGLANHTPKDCPSKTLADMDDGVWETLGLAEMKALEQSAQELNVALADGSAQTVTAKLGGKDWQGAVLRALFEITYPCQLRALDRIWRSRGKTLPGGLTDLASRDEGEYLWSGLTAMRQTDWTTVESELAQALNTMGRSFQPRTLQGFLSLEQNDWDRAIYFWQEAGRVAYSPLQRAYLAFLEGRSLEVRGELQQAMNLYRQARNESSKWVEPAYRQGVCLVKMGFTDQGLSEFLDLVDDSPHFFNRVLMDPELERGRIHILGALWKPWEEAKAAAQEKAQAIPALPEHLKSWFRDGHPFLTDALERSKVLADLAKIDNFVCFKRVVNEYDLLQADLRKAVEKDSKTLGNTLTRLYDELKTIHKEAAWFPFGKLLREFNKDFNACATKLNWMRTTSLQVPANFRKCQDYVDEVEAAIAVLKARLVTLRIVRDSTLFVLLLGKTFMWLEIIGLALSLVAVPAIIYLSQRTGQTWLAGVLESQKWQVQKGLVLIVSITAMALAALRTAVSFEKKRAKLFKDEEEKADSSTHPKKGKK